MDPTDKRDSRPPLLSHDTVTKLQMLPPEERAKVLDVASKILARQLKSRLRDIRYPVTEESISTTADPKYPGTWTPPLPYLKE